MSYSSVFLGTGAAELYSNPFCACPVCNRAREARENRLRSCFLLDKNMLIDFGPDLPAASQHYGAPLAEVRDVLVTHTHEDHLASTTFSVLTMTKPAASPICFYLSAEGLAYLNRIIELEKPLPGTFGRMLTGLIDSHRITFRAVIPYETYEIGGKQVTPLKTNHHAYGENETALNYLIRWERGNWLYAADTGLYGEENLALLTEYAAKHGPLDTLITEGTFGSIDQSDASGHMAVNLLCKQFAALRKTGILTDSTRIFLTHINPVQTFGHAEYQAHLCAASGESVTVAHDGMRI